jgi:hypothetical protein
MGIRINGRHGGSFWFRTFQFLKLTPLKLKRQIKCGLLVSLLRNGRG